MASSKTIHRVTMFKVSNPDDIPGILKIYSTMQKDAKKDGKPYILSLEAGASMEDPRNQGYTLAVTSKYASKEDMDYYDNEDEAHTHLKTSAKGKVQGVMTVYFEDAINTSGH